MSCVRFLVLGLTLVGDTKLPRCFQCTEGNIECVREPNIRFRNLHEGGKESDLSFPETQTWIPLENSST
jgi:hypothetical protein